MQTHETMKIKIILPVLLAIALLSACKKDITTKSNNPVSNATIPNTNTQRAGLRNPFEYLGVMHNQALDYIKNANGFESFDDYNRYCTAYSFTNQHLPSTKMSPKEYQVFRNGIAYLVAADNTLPKVLYSSGRIEIQTKVLLDRFLKIFSDCQASINAPSTDLIFEKLIGFEH
jgi:hypothetical protein